MIAHDLTTPLGQQQFADRISRMTAEKLAALLTPAEPAEITLAEAQEKLQIGYHALRRRLNALGIEPFQHGKGKAFPRNQLDRVRYA